MVNTPSTMLPLQTPAPDFTLADARTGAPVALADFTGRGLVVMFICNHCPFVIHVRDAVTQLVADYRPRDIDFVAINANSVESHPQDGPEHMKALAEALGWDFSYAFDASQEVAKAYRAACTPDFFLFDGDRRLFYRGQLDDSRPGNDKPVTGADLRAALDAVLAGGPAPDVQTPSLGCNIKWKPGNAPAYFG